jgi:hypothetical protein
MLWYSFASTKLLPLIGISLILFFIYGYYSIFLPPADIRFDSEKEVEKLPAL